MSIHKFVSNLLLESPLQLLSHPLNSLTYLKYITLSITQDSTSLSSSSSSTSEDDVKWTRGLNQPIKQKDNLYESQLTTSFIRILLLRCQYLCGISNISGVTSLPIDIESENGKQACSLLLLFAEISRSYLSILFPLWNDLEKLLDYGFIFHFNESRVLCVDIVSSLILHLSLFNQKFGENKNLDHENNIDSNKNWIIIHNENQIIVKSDWILNLISKIINCSNDINVIVSYFIMLLCFNFL